MSLRTITCRAQRSRAILTSVNFLRPLLHLPVVPGQGPSSIRFYTEGEILSAVKAKLKVDGEPREPAELKLLEPLLRSWERYGDLQTARAETARQISLLKDAEMKELFESEISDLDEQISDLVRQRFPALLLPPDETDSYPVMLSINPGIGGDEATACAAILSRMYQRYAENNGWKVEIMSYTPGTTAYRGQGVKEITMRISAERGNVYGTLRWEGGVHRLQRIPPNDTKGRVQSSTIAVIVLPVIPEDAETELVDPKDVKTEVMRSRGAGGQHVNKTESAVRLTHVPTGISVSMQDSRSQHQNRAWAWDILRSRLFERKQGELQAQRRNRRQEVVKGTDRSDRIRSYSVSQGRVTDHRIAFSSNLETVFEGDLDPLFYALREHHENQRLQNIIEGLED